MYRDKIMDGWKPEEEYVADIKDKTCASCKRKLPIDKFRYSLEHYSGYCSKCIECQRIYAKERVADLIFLNYTYLKSLGFKCEKCGEDNFDLLEFHSQKSLEFNPKKTSEGIDPHLKSGRNIEFLMSIIEQSECLCVKCHRLVHQFVYYDNPRFDHIKQNSERVDKHHEKYREIH